MRKQLTLYIIHRILNNVLHSLSKDQILILPTLYNSTRNTHSLIRILVNPIGSTQCLQIFNLLSLQINPPNILPLQKLTPIIPFPISHIYSI